MLGALLAVLLLPAPAHAAVETKTINFDGLPTLTRITNQYQAEGILFASPFEFGFKTGETPAKGVVAPSACGPPFTEETFATHSPPKEASIDCGGSEFPEAGTFAVLTNFAKKVSAYVGDPNQPSDISDVFRLDAYNIERNLIGHAEATAFTAEVNTKIEFEAPSYEIAYFTLYRTNPLESESAFVGMDDLSFRIGEGPPEISLSSTAGGQLAQGAQMQRSVSIVRHNGSVGNVELRAKGLPSGVSATFKPAILKGVETTSTLTLTVADNAPLEETTGVLEAEPKTVEAGSVTSTVPITLAVEPPFNVYVGLASSIPASTTLTAPPCSTAAVGVRTTIEPGFSGPVHLALSTSGETGDVSSISLEKNVLEPSDFGIAGENEQVLRIARNGNGPAEGSFQVFVTGTSGPFSEPAATVNVQRGPPIVNSISTSFGRTPQALQAGTPVTINGSGFCPGTTVQFGNPNATATPSAISPNGTQLTVNVPRLATSGPVTVLSGGASASAPTQMTIDSYRNVNAYQFHNYDPNIDFEQLTEAFGEDQTYDTIDLCWPFECNVSFRDPFAMLLNAVANATIDNGACFGMSLSSQRFLEGFRSPSQFPPGSAPTIFGLEGQGGPSGPLTNFINAMHVSQLSTEFLSHYLAARAAQAIQGGVSGSAAVFAEIQSALSKGEYPLVALAEGTTGHVVVAYDLEGAPGNYYIYVYDPNDPFTYAASHDEGSTSNGSLHQGNVMNSRIHVGSDGEWSLPSTGLNGDIGGIVVTDPSSLPTHPTMPGGLGLIKALGGLVFGSAGPGDTAGGGTTAPPPSTVAQLTDTAGHTLFDRSGKLNTNPATRLGAVPFDPLVGAAAHPAASAAPASPIILLPPGARTLKETIIGTGSGADTHTLIGHGFAGQIGTRASKGVKDTLTLAPGSNEIGFATSAARKPLTLTLLDGASRERRTAQITTTSFGGRGDALSFARSHSGLTFTHHGAASTFSLTLSALGPRSAPAVFQSGPLRIAAGQSARIGAIHWGSLTGSTLLIRLGRRSVVIHNRARSAHLASIKTLHAKKGRNGTVSLTIIAARHRLPKGAQLAFAWIVRSGGRVVATHAALERAGTGPASYKFKPRRKGRYTLTGMVTVVTIKGITQSTSRASRVLHFKV